MLDELKEATSYVTDKIVEEDSLILNLEKYALEHNVPIITKEVAKYLEFMIDLHKSRDILEIGSAIGYSGIVMARLIEKRGGTLTTIEIDEERYNQAVNNFERANLTNVDIILGDGLVEIEKLDKKFDFIFLDAAKGKYREFFDKSYDLLNEGGVIFIDNIMFRGYLYKEYPKRFKTIVRRLDEFINFLYKEYPHFVLLPFGDGIGLLQKK